VTSRCLFEKLNPRSNKRSLDIGAFTRRLMNPCGILKVYTRTHYGRCGNAATAGNRHAVELRYAL
jgi:hypothetical protein